MDKDKEKKFTLLDFVEKAVELLDKSHNVYEVRLNGNITNVVINKENKEDDSSTRVSGEITTNN